MGDDLAGPFGDLLTFGREPMKALAPAAEEDRDAEFEFELLDAVRQARLRRMAARGGAPEMPFLDDSNQVLELA